MQRGGWEPGAREDRVVDKMRSSVAGGDRSGAADVDERVTVLRSKQLAEDTNENLLRALRVSETTNETGYATLQQLGRQKETIGRAVTGVEETLGELSGARRTIRNIRMGVYKEWAVKGLVLLVLMLMDCALFYVKFIRR
ncbi:putative Qa-SNARE protein [Trypanosoma rangeli]|uniref:Putative Qa-SNARE protein n=1 Tax=Trypanosoma rangeli TaxID=5698 RepID=A0A3R7K1F7_TRYRA|nr:putative Qa-SNARE protein [Trypanosoma rangeli]RNF00125.1 putative Qa-SNARE protein [Trypanosoma rangeli]|eukprot:RNF00125.1 putative Qa-SNARE protein [Trypanosoma rangeli]